MLISLMLVLIAAIAYTLGSVNGAIVVSRYLFGSDVRNQGSGNAGLTNFYRSYGVKGMAGVVAIDFAKGIISALIGGLLLAAATPEAVSSTARDLTPLFRDTGRAFGTFCVVLGHCFPILYGFRGGKGILCGIAAVFVIDSRCAVICLLIFGITFWFSRYVSLSSIFAALSLPISMLAFGYTGMPLILCTLGVALVVLRHSSNIGRLIRGREAKMDLRRDVVHKLDEDDF